MLIQNFHRTQSVLINIGLCDHVDIKRKVLKTEALMWAPSLKILILHYISNLSCKFELFWLSSHFKDTLWRPSPLKCTWIGFSYCGHSQTPGTMDVLHREAFMQVWAFMAHWFLNLSEIFKWPRPIIICILWISSLWRDLAFDLQKKFQTLYLRMIFTKFDWNCHLSCWFWRFVKIFQLMFTLLLVFPLGKLVNLHLYFKSRLCKAKKCVYCHPTDPIFSPQP